VVVTFEGTVPKMLRVSTVPLIKVRAEVLERPVLKGRFNTEAPLIFGALVYHIL
jgi:hypothetical protein